MQVLLVLSSAVVHSRVGVNVEQLGELVAGLRDGRVPGIGTKIMKKCLEIFEILLKYLNWYPRSRVLLQATR